jgi:hypothetical protein
MENEMLPSAEEQEADRLIKIVLEDFNRHVAKESDLSTILLKGHLLVEYYMDLILVLEYDTDINVDHWSFFQKIRKLDEDKKIGIERSIIHVLYKLNELRNRLAHNLDFKISIFDIDSIGLALGREYIIEKYKTEKDVRSLTLWVIKNIVGDSFYYIYAEIAKHKNITPLLRTNKSKQTKPEDTKQTNNL